MVQQPRVKVLLDPYAEVTSELEVGEKLRGVPEQA
jgi:hypothetical protein